MTTTRTLEIELSSGRSGTGPATWGQHSIWDTVSTLGDDAARYNVSLGAPVTVALPVPAVLDALGQLLQLHDSLHTTLAADETGRLRQTVEPDGRVPVVLRPCVSDDPAEIAEEGAALLAELVGQPFALDAEWPVRVGLLESGGEARFIALVLAHTAADGWGLHQVATNLTALVLGEPPARISELRPSLQPLEEAEFQCSERGRRRDAAARQYWFRKLKAGPPRLFRDKGTGGQPGTLPFPNALLHSPALALALPRVAAVHRVGPSAVLLAAVATMTARISGCPDAVLQVVVNNRFLPGLAHAVSTLSGQALVHLPDADQDFVELLRRTQSVSLASYRHAYYDRLLLERDIAELEAGDGPVADRSCFFNDTRELGTQPVEAFDPGARADPAGIAEARSLTTLSWPIVFPPRQGVSFAVDALGAGDAVRLSMTADSALLSREEMERFLFGIEELITTTATTAQP